jgi:hypothetical protein
MACGEALPGGRVHGGDPVSKSFLTGQDSKLNVPERHGPGGGVQGRRGRGQHMWMVAPAVNGREDLRLPQAGKLLVSSRSHGRAPLEFPHLSVAGTVLTIGLHCKQ